MRTIVEEEHLGKIVYAGGDDVLAVNLKDLFEVMRKLRAAFSGHIKIENGVTKFVGKMNLDSLKKMVFITLRWKECNGILWSGNRSL